ncbi:hypothetical protein AV656_07180 [Bhargavaea cecembensis]|uniref:Bifunctional metallophosphatase/5'-nucleotidase n=1 Tax=Bhargavaea cecembensis TaxID=394098 RepID=A0A165H3K8_9BACL|nr:5'-nucleotidase C-terminal domain-containing protein [Bhargavaea cecembensis]KZE38678.1 hypothetical protein AV656_07180 [Bhargavaea cecembensis]
MKSKWIKSSAAAVLLALGFSSVPGNTFAAEGDFDLTVMHTNDTHSHVDTIPKRATIVEQIRSEHPNNLLLDAGDVFTGTLYFNEFKGEASLKLMNMLGYDAMTFGNHEFDLGSSPEGHQKLSEFVSGAQFPFVSANTDFSGDGLFDGLQHDVYTSDFSGGGIYKGIIKEIDGEQVGIFGLTTEETPDISSVGSVTFSNYISAAQEAVDAFRNQGVDKIIALTHIGFNDSPVYDNDQLLAKNVEGIDVIVGGHTHVELSEPAVYQDGRNEPTVIVQASEYGKFLGQLDVTFDDRGAITSYSGQLHDTSAAEADEEYAAILQPYTDRVKEIEQESTGVTALTTLDGERPDVRTRETNLGNLITDGMLAKAKTIDSATTIALTNGGGIRASIDEGDITVGEVMKVMPFGNSLAIMELSGAEILSALEHSVSAYPTASGGFLHVAGMKFKFDPEQPSGERVFDASVVGEDGKTTEIDPAAMYKVATNIFTAKGGDGYDMFGQAYAEGRVSEPGFADWEMFIDYIQSLGTVDPQVEGRITVDPGGLEPIGWTVQKNGKLSYLDYKGNEVTGWLEADGETFYFHKNGDLRTGWTKVDGDWYFFDAKTGAMKTGWLEDPKNGKTYYLHEDGKRQSGGQLEIGGTVYHFKNNGELKN